MKLYKEQWDKYVVPFLAKDCSEMTFIAVGQNSQPFLDFAKGRKFGRVIGVNPYTEGHIDKLPLADYTLLFKEHYSFTINDWFDYLDKLQYKTRYCIIVTTEKEHKQRCWTSANIIDIRRYFKNWDEVGFVDASPSSEKLWSLSFKSRFISKEAVDKIVCPNKLQEGFYRELDNGVKYDETSYFKALQKYRRHWVGDRLRKWVLERVVVFESIKRSGLRMPIIINSDNLILDGNHRYGAIKYLGYKEIFVRRI